MQLAKAVVNTRLRRFLVVWSVLCGLMLMHGLPAGLATGCHGAVISHSVTADAMAAGTMPNEQSSHMRVTPARQAASHADSTNAKSSTAGPQVFSAGELCVAIASRNNLSLLILGFLFSLGLIAFTVCSGQENAINRRARNDRSPPLAGRILLTHLCVART